MNWHEDLEPLEFKEGWEDFPDTPEEYDNNPERIRQYAIDIDELETMENI